MVSTSFTDRPRRSNASMSPGRAVARLEILSPAYDSGEMGLAGFSADPVCCLRRAAGDQRLLVVVPSSMLRWS